jgi:hypothetical protein
VPALVLSGEDDLRTPLETARSVAARLPNASVLVVPDAGHSALDWPTGGCARSAARNFLLGQPSEGCVRKPRFVPIDPIAPTALSQLDPVGGVGGRVGRTLAAVHRTLEDMGIQLSNALFSPGAFRASVGGLRSGVMSLKEYGLRLDRVVYAPGVAVSGELRGDLLSRGFVRVSGSDAAPGRLRLRHGRLSGTLAGRHVGLRLPAAVLGGEELPRRRKKRGGARLTPLARAGSYPLSPLGR